VIDKIFDEFQGQPGATSWFGELLTQDYNHDIEKTISIQSFNKLYNEAIFFLHNNNIVNLICKAETEPYRELVLELFRTESKLSFTFDNTKTNFLYMNGIIDREVQEIRSYIKFSSPFVQKRLFNHFSDELFQVMGHILEPFESIEHIIKDQKINIKNLLRQYEKYLKKNKNWLFKDAPKRKDLRVFEAVYHFNLYMYLFNFLSPKGGHVYPEFPTGNGKIDLIIRYKENVYLIELKSYTDESGYYNALEQAAKYGKEIQSKDVFLAFFVESLSDEIRKKYEINFFDKKNQVTVWPVLIETGI